MKYMVSIYQHGSDVGLLFFPIASSLREAADIALRMAKAEAIYFNGPYLLHVEPWDDWVPDEEWV